MKNWNDAICYSDGSTGDEPAMADWQACDLSCNRNFYWIDKFSNE